MVCLHAAFMVLALTSAPSGNSQTVLLDFYADWCGPCRSMDSTVHELAAAGHPVRRVNVDREHDLAARFGVQNIPCFVMVVNGSEAGRVVGPTSLGRLEQLCSLGGSSAAPGAMLAGQTPPRMMAPGPMAGTVPRTSWPANSDQTPASDAALLAASVRIRVEDPDGHSCGSGTIIDYRPGGEALVLTCGHLFRDSQGKGHIDLDLFGASAASHLTGRLVGYDMKRDLGLVAFKPQGPVVVTRVAPPGYPIHPRDPVASVGCNSGNDPTVQRSSVVTIDRFQGPPNIEVAGQPIEGRSGGGLFSPDGLVIGVCNAADPEDREGLFAALASIQSVLEEQNLATIYRQPVGPAAPAILMARGNAIVPMTEMAAAITPVGGADPFTNRGSAAPHGPDSSVAAPAALAAAPSAALPSNEQAAMDEIRRHAKEDSEIVCIIRNRQDPQSKSEVITLDHASAAFIGQLTASAQPHGHIDTAMEVAKPRTPLLEWDVEKGWTHHEALPTVTP